MGRSLSKITDLYKYGPVDDLSPFSHKKKKKKKKKKKMMMMMKKKKKKERKKERRLVSQTQWLQDTAQVSLGQMLFITLVLIGGSSFSD